MEFYSEIIHKTRYAKFLDDKGRREHWEETVDRYVSFMKNHVKKQQNVDIPDSMWVRIRTAIVNQDVMPSMRAMMSSGKSLEKDSTCAYNCSYLPIDDPKSFDEALHILMNAAGVGFSVERQYINKLPEIPEKIYESDTVITVKDSKEGWAKALRQLIALLYTGEAPKYDLSKLRPKGAKLKTFGGRSSGPGPLDDLFKFVIKTFKNAQGRKLNSLECHDIMCKIGEVVVVGGVRRAALISLSNLSDDRMRHAKSGAWWEQNSQRMLANNSAVYTEKPDIGLFMKEWLSLYDSKSGERGIVNREAMQKVAMRNGRRDPNHDLGTNPCSEIILRPYQFCNLSEVIIRSDDTDAIIKDKIEIATVIGTIQSTITHFPYLRKIWKTNTEEERLLGVSLTGIYDNKRLNDYQDKTLPARLQALRQLAVDTNKHWAEFLGIPQSAAITAVKPSGNVSELTGTASGIHPRHDKYYYRRIRNNKMDPVTNFLIEAGVEHEDDVMNPSNVVFTFPKKAPTGAKLKSDISAIDHLELWLMYQDNYCVDGNTQILTKSGYQKIKDLVDLDVEIWNGFNWSSVKPFRTGVKKLYAVEFSDGSIVNMTDDHKIILEDSSRKMLKDFDIENDAVYSNYEFPVLDNKIFDEEMTDAYSQGFYSGDGYTNGNWTLVYPPKYSCLSRLKGKVNDKETSNRGKYWKHSDANVVEKCFVPINNSLNYKLNWLAGIIDSDGTQEPVGTTICSTDRNFLQNIKLMLTTIGVKSRIGKSLSPRGYGISNYQYLYISGKALNQLLSLGLITSRVDLKGAKTKSSLKKLSVVNITEIGFDETYCFTEELNHSGVFNGVYLGQCEHKPSVTVSVKEEEWLEVGAWCYKNFDQLSGVSFLPYDGGSYKQAPYESIDETKYNELLAKTPKNINWENLKEEDDQTVSSQSLACVASSDCSV